MKLRTVSGLVVMAAAIAAGAAAIWVPDSAGKARGNTDFERDLFGAPVVEQQAPQLPIAGSAPAQSQPAGQPEDKSDVLPQLPVGPQQPGAEPAEPFKLPQITAYA